MAAPSISQKWNQGKWVFYDKHRLGYPYYHIHPHKQEAIKYVVENIPDWVTNVIVFGSSVGTWHIAEKDIDICIVGDNPDAQSLLYRKEIKPKGIGCDFLEKPDMKTVKQLAEDKSSVYFDIWHKGVMVYEKG